MERISGDSFVDLSQEDFAQQRNAARDSLLLRALMRHAGLSEPVQVRVRNLSAGGLMAEYAEPLNIGAKVEIDVRGIGWVQGSVAWATDGRIGVAFDNEIDPKAARKPVGGGTHTPVYVKPPLRNS
ncbi:PilZ domain-containing protein [Stakelama sp. CBK3Z-3]|uniref:PilZ domain-containing protein n=1 Tax=Stakelama flava TaxID=2860338 RepID=A0ABS6XH97_9SPHN|nr:PilZ domain-containing protein [Stakelama flava]MBW4329284.1 PilZ domain-containing protein [Stakelama flava]